MELDAHQENKLTLESILGVTGEKAETILSETVFINYEAAHSVSAMLAHFLEEILSRTVSSVSFSRLANPSVEIVIGTIKPITDATHIFVNIKEDTLEISEHQNEKISSVSNLHPSFLIMAACYIAAFSMRRLIGQSERLPFPPTVILDFKKIFPDQTFLNDRLNIGKVYLAGAGAIGNSFLYALREFDVEGELTICDDDHVSSGNLNRCIWFDGSHIGMKKATTLVKVAQPYFQRLNLSAYEGKLGTIPDKNNGGAWLERLVVAVDSRRVRRSLQSEIPKEVYDASTTNIEEVCLHFSRRPLNGMACLECAYYQDAAEKAHEHHIAEVLGVSVAEIELGNVSREAAVRIATKYPGYAPDQLHGQSYDTLFKELCGKDKIKMKNEEQILAPFAFVSVLAGTVLAVEFVHRIRTNACNFNSWRLSPWSSPVMQLKQMLPKNDHCTFCTHNMKNNFAERLWG